MKKGLLLLSLLVATATNFAHADDAAIKQTLTRLDMQGAEILPSPMAGMSRWRE